MFLNLDTKADNRIAARDNEGNVLTYGVLVEQLKKEATLISARSIVFILCKNTVGALFGYLASVHAESVPLLLNSKIDSELLKELIMEYRPKYFWTPIELDIETPHTVLSERYGYKLLESQFDIYPINDSLQLLMSTSGTTGSPKLVRYKKGNLEANAKNVSIAFGWTEIEKPICDLGIQYTMGLNVINAHLYVGAELLLTTYNLMSGDFWDFIKMNQATNFTGVPFSYHILSRLHFEKMDLPHLRTLSQGGGKLTDEKFRQLALFAQETGRRFIASFGTTETSARMSCLPAELATTKTGSIGRPIPEGEMFLIDSDGNVLSETESEGELCYRGPNVTLGYAYCREDLIKGDDFNGEYRTGDLARRDSDGCYYITGRLSRFLKLLSYRISLDQCERLILDKFNIECACTGNDQRMDIYITDPALEKVVVDYLSDKLGLFSSLFHVNLVQRIERTDSGKINYKALNS